MKLSAGKVDKLKSVAIGSTIAIGAATGLFFLARHFIRSMRANASQKDSMNEGDPATFAKQLKMAFENDLAFGWGTNEEAVKEVFSQIPSKAMYSRVQKEYSKMYNQSLNADLEDEMSSDEYNELIRILNSKNA
jgi:uncharacterized protein YneF (UPF0154 family)